MEGDIEIIGMLFQIKGDFNAKEEIRLKEITSYSAHSLFFRRIIESHNGTMDLANAIKLYNSKLRIYCIAESALI